LLHRIESEVAPQADSKRLAYRTRDTSLAAHSDPALVELIVRNLVTNAVRYTQRGGVLVAVRRRGDQVALEVWDTGVGIPADQLQHIFREFHQLGNSERDRQKGLGLGLAIAKGLANELSHVLTVRSVVGRGSCFRLTMPVAKDVVAFDAYPGHMSHLQPLKLRVLVIDDDDLVQEAMKRLLETWDCQCHAVESAQEAMSQDWQQPPQLILSDYRLRNQTTGADAIAALQLHWQTPIPAILLTGDTAKERLREAASSGITLLHKPVSPAQLHQHIVRLVMH
jgi:two-component system, sensor histidine kinase